MTSLGLPASPPACLLLHPCAAGAPVDALDPQGGNTALHYAAQYGHAEAVDCLLKAGASLTTRNQHGATPFFCE